MKLVPFEPNNPAHVPEEERLEICTPTPGYGEKGGFYPKSRQACMRKTYDKGQVTLGMPTLSAITKLSMSTTFEFSQTAAPARAPKRPWHVTPGGQLVRL